jgi:PAS domain S-box-containing protein
MATEDIQKPDWLLQMEAILQMLNEGVIIADHGLRLLFVNDKLLRLGGYQRQDMLGRTPRKFTRLRARKAHDTYASGPNRKSRQTREFQLEHP